MTTIKSLIRITFLFLLGIVALFLLLGIESDSTSGSWLIHAIIDKTLAVILFWTLHTLYLRWLKTDAWLIAYDKFCRQVNAK